MARPFISATNTVMGFYPHRILNRLTHLPPTAAQFNTHGLRTRSTYDAASFTSGGDAAIHVRSIPNTDHKFTALTCQPRRDTTFSTASPTSRILRSVFCVPAIIRPTGAALESWQGTDRAQPSNRFTIAGLRSMRRFRRAYVSSSLLASAIVGAVSGVVGISMAS